MQSRHFTVLATLLSIVLSTFVSNAQNIPFDSLRFVDASEFRIINRAFADTVPLYTRVPDSKWHMLRDELKWGMGCSTGIGVRFRTNSRTVAVRYRLRYDFAMSWMAYTGIKGTDLYILADDNRWNYLATSKPRRDSVQTAVYTRHLDGREHEFLLNLPLYDGVTKLEIGVEPQAQICYPKAENPRTKGGKIVFFGTSVMQGGCATRPGMTQTNILQRELGVECCNLGVSGQGKLYLENAELLSQTDDAICFVIDPIMNCSIGMVDTLAVPFVRLLRQHYPKVAIVMVEGLIIPTLPFDRQERDKSEAINSLFFEKYRQLRREGIRDLYYVRDRGFTADNAEGTVDGVHLTDLGFQQYSDQLLPLLRKIIRKYSK